MRMFKSFHYMDSPSEFQYLTEEKLMAWGLDGAQNYGYDVPQTCEEAIDLLHDIGDVQIQEVWDDGE